MGLTSNVAARLAAHNAGHSTHTADRGPWAIDLIVEFNDEKRAVAFEKYLKSGSGVAFAKRHSDKRTDRTRRVTDWVGRSCEELQTRTTRPASTRAVMDS